MKVSVRVPIQDLRISVLVGGSSRCQSLSDQDLKKEDQDLKIELEDPGLCLRFDDDHNYYCYNYIVLSFFLGGEPVSLLL